MEADDCGKRSFTYTGSDGSLTDPATVTVNRVTTANITGTAANDVTETRALRQVLGAHADKIAISSTKSMVGHALGAAGALELVATIMAVREGVAPPTIGYLGPDPDCDLDYVPNAARPMAIEYALSNSFGFGGTNAALLFKRFEA